jgi:hypothetical protein
LSARLYRHGCSAVCWRSQPALRERAVALLAHDLEQ